MNKKTIAASIPAPAIGGVLTGAEQTTTGLRALSDVATAPLYSKSFHLTNGFNGVTLELVGVEGKHEGVPPIGSTIAPGESQNFEVQYLADRTGNVWATYQVTDSIRGVVGNVQIQMGYGAFGETKATIAFNNSAIKMSLGGSPTGAIIQPHRRRVSMKWSFE